MSLHTAEQGGTNKQGAGFMGCSWIKETGLANLGRSSVCRKSLKAINMSRAVGQTFPKHTVNIHT